MRTAFFLLLSACLLGAEPVSLFDGESLAGWKLRPGEEKWWKVEDGLVTGGSLTEKVPHNTFLASEKSYGDFELKMSLRFVPGEGFINSGMQIRSQRVEDSHEMRGYQIDAGEGYWGDIYDESRRNKAVAQPIDVEALAAAVKEDGWNHYRILAEGPRIRVWINGVAATDYTEEDPEIPRTGLLGLQAHSGGTFLIQMKDVSIREIQPDGARDPEDQRQGFKLPEGFTAELVASEEQGVHKPITVVWDRHGRMWTMTATEYPVDANENAAAADALFERGGGDRVLIFDEPNAPGPQTPRVFAEGLAIPLGLLPYKDGALVQHGREIRHYRDTNGDGRADTHEVILEGFGIQDSHLFPHQFERAPGGWIYLAQGLFNASEVRRPGGLPFSRGETSVTFNHCKLARFRADGSAFENLTAGPNNIWGLATDRSGETFLQEANDLGYPVAEFAPGTHYPTGSREKLRPDAPTLPPSTAGPKMGGTGLSGLAIAEDRDSPFTLGHGDKQVFYIANPITSRIQIVTLERDENGHPIYRKADDFLLSEDPWFRPIAVHFGPDGCLYIVDWYNKIISHNEVPRTHPDRDKSSGRIWRIRHESQKPQPRPDLAKLDPPALIGLLGGPGALISKFAWQEISDRGESTSSAALTAIVADTSQPPPKRIAALFALEGLGAIAPDLLATLAGSDRPALRHEAVRIAGETSLPENEFLPVLEAVKDDPHFRVRAAIANSIRSHRAATPAMVAHAAALGREPLTTHDRAAYDRNFECYLSRWAMADHHEATRQLLEENSLPPEPRLLAARALPDAEAAAAMLAVLPEIPRGLTADELSLLGSQLVQPQVLETFGKLLLDPQQTPALLRALLALDPAAANSPQLSSLIESAAAHLLETSRSPDHERLAIDLARRFRLPAFLPEIRAWAARPDRSETDLALALATLRETRAAAFDDFRPHLDHPAEAVRREAILGLGSVDDPAAVTELISRWPDLPGAHRSLALDGMTSTPAKAEALAQAISGGNFPASETAALERLLVVLGPDHPALAKLLAENASLLRPVIQLDGKRESRLLTKLDLDGPFTIEGWVRLEGSVGNEDSLFGREGGPDINFYAGRPRLYGGPGIHDLIIANRPVEPGRWTHLALTRDGPGNLLLYLDGESAAEAGLFTDPLTGLNLGESNASPGSHAAYDEVRIWDHARSAEEIQTGHLTRFDSARKPPGLLHLITAASAAPLLEGGARIALTTDFPELLTPADSAALAEKFTRFRTLAESPGDPAKGHDLARATCLICHQAKGEGIALGPDLSGAGAMGTEAILRNILTPNAQLESGYYRHDLKLKDGTTLSGFLASETADQLVLRQIGADDRLIPRTEIESHAISRRSLMPEGLIDGFTDSQVADLFAFLNSLR